MRLIVAEPRVCLGKPFTRLDNIGRACSRTGNCRMLVDSVHRLGLFVITDISEENKRSYSQRH